MKNYEVGVPSPIGADKKLEAQYTKLAGQVGELAAKRRAVTTSLPFVSPLVPNPEADLATFDAELDLLKSELPVWKQLPDYIELIRKNREHERMIADELIEQARNHVRAIFERDFPPSVWPTRGAAVLGIINNHPIVLGAIDRQAELISGDESGQRLQVEQTIQAAEKRMKDLPTFIQVTKQAVKSRADEKARKEAGEREQKEQSEKHQATIQAARQKAADEARRRLAANK